VTESIHIERIPPDSTHLVHAASLHADCMPETITSQRGALTLAGIYRRLLRHGHSIYVATKRENVVGGIVVMEHQQHRSTLLTLVHRPQSWLGAIRQLGVASFFQQLRDVVAVQRIASKLPAHNYIVAVYVDSATRRAGVARQLLTQAMESARARGVVLAVDTLQSNSAAQHLYRSLGFMEYQRTKKSVIFTLGVE
jgi:ribosomal protein S18 acetylase RimI-like enzyme